jgi:hypothetical protein
MARDLLRLLDELMPPAVALFFSQGRTLAFVRLGKRRRRRLVTRF